MTLQGVWGQDVILFWNICLRRSDCCCELLAVKDKCVYLDILRKRVTHALDTAVVLCIPGTGVGNLEMVDTHALREWDAPSAREN